MNKSEYDRHRYLKDKNNRELRLERARNQKEYQKKYRTENKEKLAKYHLDYMREKRWLNGSENYSGELG